MPCIKIVPKLYVEEGADKGLIDEYIYRKALAKGGLAVDPVHAVEHMRIYRQLLTHQPGAQLYHFILAFSERESRAFPSINLLVYMAYEICSFLADEYQIIFGIHDIGYPNNKRWHIHFAMNAVSYRTGKRYRRNKYTDAALKNYVECVVGKKVEVYYN